MRGATRITFSLSHNFLWVAHKHDLFINAKKPDLQGAVTKKNH